MGELVPYVSHLTQLKHEVPPDVERARIQRVKTFFEHIRGVPGKLRTWGEVVNGWPSSNPLDTRMGLFDETVGILKVGDGVRIGEPDYANGCIYIFNISVRLNPEERDNLSLATIDYIDSPDVVVHKGFDQKGNRATVIRNYDLYNERCVEEIQTIQGENTNRRHWYDEEWLMEKHFSFTGGKKQLYYTYIDVGPDLKVRIWRDPETGTVIKSLNEDGKNEWWLRNGRIVYFTNPVLRARSEAEMIRRKNTGIGRATSYHYEDIKEERRKKRK